jgi:hypothetical protein
MIICFLKIGRYDLKYEKGYNKIWMKGDKIM